MQIYVIHFWITFSMKNISRRDKMGSYQYIRLYFKILQHVNLLFYSVNTICFEKHSSLWDEFRFLGNIELFECSLRQMLVFLCWYQCCKAGRFLPDFQRKNTNISPKVYFSIYCKVTACNTVLLYQWMRQKVRVRHLIP